MIGREQLLIEMLLDRLRPAAEMLLGDGWAPQLVVFAPSELERIPGYKVGLVVPIDVPAKADA